MERGRDLAKPVYGIVLRAPRGLLARTGSVPPGRAQREPQGYAGLTSRDWKEEKRR